MPNSDYQAHVMQIPIFRALPPDLFTRVLNEFQQRRYNPGEFVFRQGEATRGLHILVQGRAQFQQLGVDGLLRTVGEVRGGQYVNGEALFQAGVETASLQVVEPVTALLLTRETFATLLSHYPELKASLGLGNVESHIHQVRFKLQREDEEVLLKTRRHWLAYARWLPVPALLLGAFLGLAALIPPLAGLFSVLGVLFSGVLTVYLYVEWANDTIIITDQRVIHITRTLLTFSEVVNEVNINSIQEVNAGIPGNDPLALLLGYGRVEIITAGSAGNLRLGFMPAPESIQKLVLETLRHRQAERSANEMQTMRAEVERWLRGGPPPGKGPALAADAPGRGVDLNEGTAGMSWSPLRTRFSTKEGGIVYRKHWLVWLRAVTLPILFMLAAIATLVLPLVLASLQPVAPFMLGAGMIVLIISVGWFAFRDWDWRNDYLVLQDDVVLFIHQRPLWLQSDRDQVLLRQVDNVIAESSGLLRRIFSFGDLRLSLIGADAHKTFRNVPRPLELQAEITRRQSLLKRRETEKREREQRQVVGEYLALYHEMTGGTPESAPQYSAPLPTMTQTTYAVRPQMPGTPAPGPSITPGRPYVPPMPAAQPTLPQPPISPAQPTLPQPSMPAAQPTLPQPPMPTAQPIRPSASPVNTGLPLPPLPNAPAALDDAAPPEDLPGMPPPPPTLPR